VSAEIASAGLASYVWTTCKCVSQVSSTHTILMQAVQTSCASTLSLVLSAPYEESPGIRYKHQSHPSTGTAYRHILEHPSQSALGLRHKAAIRVSDRLTAILLCPKRRVLLLTGR
jgi:hypothetical protein